MRTSKAVNFFMWEIIAVFFIVSFTPLMDKIPESELGGVVLIVFQLIWIMLALFSLLMGLVQMRR